MASEDQQKSSSTNVVNLTSMLRPASTSELPVPRRAVRSFEETAVCAHCGTEFTYQRTRRPRKYCSDRCKGTALQNRRGKENERIRLALLRQQSPETFLLASARNYAKKSGLTCSIDKAWIREKLDAGRCAVTGLPFAITPYAPTRKNNRGYYAPSLDRIDPGGHYTPSNTRLVVWGYNLAKGSYPDREVIAMTVGAMINSIN